MAGSVALCRYRCVVEPELDFSGEERRPVLWYTRPEWDAFLDGVKKCEFDDSVQGVPDNYRVPIIDTKELVKRERGDYSPLGMAIFSVASLKAFFEGIKVGVYDTLPDGFSTPDELLVLPWKSYDARVFGDSGSHV